MSRFNAFSTNLICSYEPIIEIECPYTEIFVLEISYMTFLALPF